MSDTVKRINAYFRDAVKSDIDRIKENAVFSERQERVFEMYYLKKNDIGFIADTLGTSYSVIKSEIKIIRRKISQII